MKSSSYRRSTKERNGIHVRHTNTQLKYVHIIKAVILKQRAVFLVQGIA